MRVLGVDSKLTPHVWASILVLSAACSGKAEHPAALPDETKDGAAGSHGGFDDADIPETGASDDGGSFGPSAIFQPCWSDVMMQGGIKADIFFCFVTYPGHPANNTDTRNFLYPIIQFSASLDAMDRELLVHVGTYLTWSVTAPDGAMLTPGATYSTDANDGTAIHFSWNKGDCGTDPEQGGFFVRELTWDMDNKVTTAAIDFTHHCGNPGPMYARFRMYTSTPP